MLYRMRVGCPWRDVPADFGAWNAIYKKFNNWSSQGKWLRLFKTLVNEPDFEWVFIDGSIVKAHQHSAGLADQAIGKSRGGYTSKIHMGVDAQGLPVEFIITGGEVNDIKQAPELIAGLTGADYIIADKGYDSESFRQQIRDQNTLPVIPRKTNSTVGNDDMDWCLYKYRHLVEHVFARLKHFRAVATRYDKLMRNYQATVALACLFLWLPM